MTNILMIRKCVRDIDELRNILNKAAFTSHLLSWIMDKFAVEHTRRILDDIEKILENDTELSKKPIDMRENRLWAVKVSRRFLS